MADIDQQARVQQTPVFGEHGEPCQDCGAPLAADQRYCLNCGKRRGGPRVDYRELMGASSGETPAQQPTAPIVPAPEPQKAERDYAPLAAVGGIAVLGLMLLVGVLIGKGNNTTTATPAPIVKVGGEAATTASSAGEAEKSKTASTGSKGSKKSGKADTGAKEVAGGLTGSAAQHSEGPVQASTNDLESLENQSGEDYENEINKLPDKIATPGAPPPIDTTKAPGGGGSAETIK